MTTTRVILFHQHDPGMDYVGGIFTFLNTFVKHAPSDFEVNLVGVTADAAARPVGRWHRLSVAGRPLNFLPLVAANQMVRETIPLSVRLTAALRRHRGLIDFTGAVLDLHRIEPAWALRDLPNPKVLVLHAHSEDLYNPHTEVAWKKAPWLYFLMERTLIGGMTRVYIVREDAVAAYKQQYPKIADRVEFLPTWVDEDVFVSLPEAQRREQRQQLAQEHGFDPSHRLLLFVGRFEGQKDPLMLLESFRRLNGLKDRTQLVMIGEGSMEGEIRGFLSANGLEKQILLLGPRPQTEIARWMNAADSLVLSSAFEGMPRVVVEALGTGLPVVTTAVGEAPRLVSDARAGRLVQDRTPEAFSAAIADLLQQPPDREACLRQIESFTAKKILGRVYASYRDLAAQARKQ